MRASRRMMMILRRWATILLLCWVTIPLFLVYRLPLQQQEQQQHQQQHQHQQHQVRREVQQQNGSQANACSFEQSSAPLILDSDAFCSGSRSCDSRACFHRLNRGMCVSASQVTACDVPEDRKLGLPSIMRFRGERLTTPVVVGKCDRLRKDSWIPGLSMVADQRFLPYKKPNPHHEAEKIIPATLLVHKLGLLNTSLYWFTSPDEVSDWGKGLLRAVDMEQRVKYVELPERDEICFEDAIIFSPPTNVRYVPSHQVNSWLRTQVLNYCSLPIRNASSTPASALILDRQGSRHLANKDQIANVVARVMDIPVRTEFTGRGSFCNQVSKVAAEDLVIVPHGSQNVNLLFAAPGAQVIEVFPYLFYNDALKNYTHSTQIRIHPLLGKRPPGNFLMRFFSLLGWDLCYHRVRWCKNYSRQQPIHADLLALEGLLTNLTSNNRI